MRIRCIKPEFWADEQIARWPAESRLAYIALWNEADDAGRLRANSAYLLSRLFPYERGADMAAILRPIVQAGKLQLYEVAGQAFGELLNFRRHQVINKPTASKLPPPPDSAPDSTPLQEDSHRTTVGLRGGLEQGREQGKDIRPAPDAPTAEAIYEEYPRKAHQKDAIRAIAKAMSRKPAKELLERCRAYAEAVKGMELQFIPLAATWFSGERFDDAPEAWNPHGKRFVPAPKLVEAEPEPANWRAILRKHRPDACVLDDIRDWRFLPGSTHSDVRATLGAIEAERSRSESPAEQRVTPPVIGGVEMTGVGQNEMGSSSGVSPD